MILTTSRRSRLDAGVTDPPNPPQSAESRLRRSRLPLVELLAVALDGLQGAVPGATTSAHRARAISHPSRSRAMFLTAAIR